MTERSARTGSDVPNLPRRQNGGGELAAHEMHAHSAIQDDEVVRSVGLPAYSVL
jgi:hypothetical protein